MADNKRWFKVWTSILSDPGFDELPNDCAGVWIKLGALLAKHGCNGNISVTKTQFCKRTNTTEKDLPYLQQKLKNINVDIDSDCNGNISVTFLKWHNYQVNTDSYERVKRFREKRLVTEVCNVSRSVTKDKDKDKEKEKEEIKKRKRFIPPTIEEVTTYCEERKNTINPKKWIDHYTSNGWMVGKNPMRDWKASVRNWENNREVKLADKYPNL